MLVDLGLRLIGGIGSSLLGIIRRSFGLVSGVVRGCFRLIGGVRSGFLGIIGSGLGPISRVRSGLLGVVSGGLGLIGRVTRRGLRLVGGVRSRALGGVGPIGVLALLSVDLVLDVVGSLLDVLACLVGLLLYIAADPVQLFLDFIDEISECHAGTPFSSTAWSLPAID
jgi:hypothetical protein